MYQLNYGSPDGKVSGIKRTRDSASIPLAEGNTDYQAFLEWNSKQTVPLKLDSIYEPTPEEVAAKLKIETDMANIEIAKTTIKTAILTEDPNPIKWKIEEVVARIKGIETILGLR